VDVHHVVDGPADGDVVVLSGSLGSDLRMWEPQVAPLVDAGFRVVRYDHRGHGASPVPDGPYTLADLGGDALALMARLGAGRVHWVGLSLGGMVGMWLAAHHPQRIGNLALCCTSARLPGGIWAERAALVRAEGTAAVARSVVERWFTPQWRAANPEAVAHYERMVSDAPAEGYASCCGAIETMEVYDALPSITAPTLVLAGADDPATPPEHGRRIAERVPGARLEVLVGAAHLANVEQPELFGDLLLAHLEENP
jgi:3-oxoadipate enol-lactonase